MSTKTKRFWAYEMHLPPGSADGNYVVFDATTDNGDTIAIVDPNGVCAGLDIDPEEHARLIAAAPDLLDACKNVQNWLKEYIGQYGTDPMDGGLAQMHNDLLAVIAKAEGSAAS